MSQHDASRGADGRSAATPPQLPAERYGAAQSGANLLSARMLAIVLVVLAIGLVVAIGAYFYQQVATPKVSAETISTQPVDEHSLTVSISVSSNRPEQDAYCIVRAKEFSGAEVGRADVLIPAGQKDVRMDVTVPTTSAAQGGDVYGCGFDIPPFLKTHTKTPGR